MKKTWVLGTVAAALAVGGVLGAQAPPPAPEVEALRADLAAARQALEAQEARVQELEVRLRELEARLAKAERAGEPVVPVAPPSVASTVQASWKDGTTTLTFPRAEVRLANRLQIRWTDSRNGDPEKTDTGAFRIRRFKTQLQGWAYTPDLTFLLQVDWANANTSLGILDDAAVNFDFTHGKGRFQVRAGQFKTPFGRQSLASTRTDLFADRSFVTYEFCSIRDVGILFHGKVGPASRPDLLEYAAGLFNGEGRSRYDNPDGKYQKNLRVVVSPWGSAGYDEAGLHEAPGFRVSFGAAYEENDHRVDRKGLPPAGKRYETRAYDLLARWKRLTAYGEYFDRTSWDSGAEPVKSDGLNAQVGLLLLPDRWEVFAGRWTFDPSREFLGDRRVEWGLGTNLYFAGFSSKLQADWRRIRDEKRDTRDTEFRLQYQIVF